MPSILVWNIEHSSGYQDVFSPKNQFVNEVLARCIQKYGVSVIVLLEVTDTGSVAQFAYNRGLSLSTFGEGTTLKYAIMTSHAHECRDVTDYFPSFANKPRGMVHVSSANGSAIPPLLVTHIKSDLGMSGIECLADIGNQMRENIHSSPRMWPYTGVIALADWNLEASEALKVTTVNGGRIVAPQEPTRYPSIPAHKIMQPVGNAKTLDYGCVFGALAANPSLGATVPDVFDLRSIKPLLDTYLERVGERVATLNDKSALSEANLSAALTAGNLTEVGMNAALDEQRQLSESKDTFERVHDAISEFRDRIASRDRLDDNDKRVFRQLVAQAGLGPDHVPVVISW
jgi:hypothetical protein